MFVFFLLINKKLVECVRDSICQCQEYRDTVYAPYSYLWSEDRQAFLEELLQQDPSRGLVKDEQWIHEICVYSVNLRAISRMQALLREKKNGKQSMQIESKNSKQKLLEKAKARRKSIVAEKEVPQNQDPLSIYQPLHDFEVILELFQTFTNDVSQLSPIHQCDCIKIDAQPIKLSLLNVLGKWRYMVLQYLESYVLYILNHIDEFIESSSSILSQSIAVGQQDQLVSILQTLKTVRTKAPLVEQSLPTIQLCLDILLKHFVSSHEDLSKRFDAAPGRWSDLLKLGGMARENIRELLSVQVEKVVVHVQDFGIRIKEFEQHMKKHLPQSINESAISAYAILDRLQEELEAFEQEAVEILELETLYDMETSDCKWYHCTISCIEALQDHKELWDVCGAVTTELSRWKSTIWKQLDADMLDDRLRLLQILCNEVSVRAREWPLYSSIRSTVLELQSYLPIIQELKSDVMRERHWVQLLANSRTNSSSVNNRPISDDFSESRHISSPSLSLSTTHFDTASSSNSRLGVSGSFQLCDLLALNLHKIADTVMDIVQEARKEYMVESVLSELRRDWFQVSLEFIEHSQSGIMVLKPPQDMLQSIDERASTLQSMASGRNVRHFFDEIKIWLNRLSTVDATINTWINVQMTWDYLFPIFQSHDIRTQLPDQAIKFDRVHNTFCSILQSVQEQPDVSTLSMRLDLTQQFISLQQEQEHIQRALDEYLEVKRCRFPRFYFVTSRDLLHMLSNTTNGIANPNPIAHATTFDNAKLIKQTQLPSRSKSPSPALVLAPHLPNLFDNICDLDVANMTGKINVDAHNTSDLAVVAVFSGEGERFALRNQVIGWGEIAVEDWLSQLQKETQDTVHQWIQYAISDPSRSLLDRSRWLLTIPAQVAVLVSQILWSSAVHSALDSLENGDSNALHTCLADQISQLQELVTLLGDSISASEATKNNTQHIHPDVDIDGSTSVQARNKRTSYSALNRPFSVSTQFNQHSQNRLTRLHEQILSVIVTLDVHNRDVVQQLIQQSASGPMDFAWRAQLRSLWDVETTSCILECCDARFIYGNEYMGNRSRLVITPLTDRCVITLTQALRVSLGGAPSGPAGTGKTETTKDLGRALGRMVYVFNCSEQMNALSLSNNFKGLAQSGAWGCFDEFNRIHVSVLSVVASQVRCVLEAMRMNRELLNKDARPAFVFEGQKIFMSPLGCGIFVTMNPGYAGRTELPESLKTLFRPVTMVVPDSQLICENILLSLGFLHAELLANKIVSLMKLASIQLSPSPHYEWGLRAIKAILSLANALRARFPLSPLSPSSEPSIDQINKQSPPSSNLNISQIEHRCIQEQALLAKAIREYNLPRLISDDTQIFLQLLLDFFPKIQSETNSDTTFQSAVQSVLLSQSLQPTAMFVCRVSQLRDLLAVRHCVFLLGPPMAGKSELWKTLARAQQQFGTISAPTHTILSSDPKQNTFAGTRTLHPVINPNTLSTDELYGYFDYHTREWRDGVLSHVMRSLAKLQQSDGSGQEGMTRPDSTIDLERVDRRTSKISSDSIKVMKQYSSTNVSTRRKSMSMSLASVVEESQRFPVASGTRWIILDGTIAPDWIETLNSTMDDNKVLTLANNDRIPLKPSMRLIFESLDLKHATPATVSRAGVLYINDQDIGWEPLVHSWLDSRTIVKEQQILQSLFEKHMSDALSFISSQCSYAFYCAPSTLVYSTLILLHGLLSRFSATMADMAQSSMISTREEQSQNFPLSIESICESCFILAMAWGLGSGLSDKDKVVFDAWMRSEIKMEFSPWNCVKEEMVELSPSPLTIFDMTLLVSHSWSNSSRMSIRDPYSYIPNSILQLQSNSTPPEKMWTLWSKLLEQNGSNYSGELLLNSLFIPTVDAMRNIHITRLLISHCRSVMIVAPHGSGKSILLQQAFGDKSEVSKSDLTQSSIRCSSKTTAKSLQSILESQLEKKAGKTVAPPDGKTLVFILQDLNVPEVYNI